MRLSVPRSTRRRAWRACAWLAPALLLSACGSDNGGPIVVDIIGSRQELLDPMRHADSQVGATMLAATEQGLLAFDAQGEVVAALAESWIVADQGRSYIFRLKRTRWPNGEVVRAEQVAPLLQQRMRANPKLLAGLEPQIRAMTDRVIEIRLETALPTFLQLVAQPELALRARPGGTGPYVAAPAGDRIELKPPPRDPDESDADADAPAPRPIDDRLVTAARASLAAVRFSARSTDLVLGGRFQDLPVVQVTRQAGSDLRADPVSGLFGFAVSPRSELLEDRAVRNAISSVIDRQALATALSLSGWIGVDQPLPAPLDLRRAPTEPEWRMKPMPQRLEDARAVMIAWIDAHGRPPALRVALPIGAGASMLFQQLVKDLRPLAIELQRVPMNSPADLILIDEVAPFDSALWYLSRIDCDRGISCNPDSSAYLESARTAQSAIEQAQYLGEAERLSVEHAGFIPLGQPIRWSLVSQRVTGFQPSPRGQHPLNRLLAVPN